jgi:hypothetical protein
VVNVRAGVRAGVRAVLTEVTPSRAGGFTHA